jgi:hypothetical protein
MDAVTPDILKIIVLACHPHTLLRISRPFIGSFIDAKKHILELHHACIGEEQGLITSRDERSGRNDSVTVLNEEINKLLSDLCTGWFLGIH